ncbi:hypothetical protein JST97_17100 [bacterium]|nr:hypothetical protein [bacterium]
MQLKREAAGLFFLALATMLFELILTRVLSVVFWYHFSFLAISVAMLGITVGSTAVYLYPNFFGLGGPEGGTPLTLKRVAQGAHAFAWAAFFSYPAQLQLTQAFSAQPAAVWQTPLFLILVLIPFALSGMSISLLLTYRLRSSGLLYAVDLTGAALGCLLVPCLLTGFTPSQIMLLACLLPLVAGWVVDRPDATRKGSSALLALLVLVGAGLGGMPLKVVKERPADPYLYDLWNSYSRVTVREQAASPLWLAHYQGPPIQSRNILIDGGAGTDVLQSDGDFSKLDYLATDITSAVYYLKKNASVLIIGCGGGRDVATALHFGNTDVSTIEMNSNTLSLLRGPLAAYSGHLLDKVKVHEEEARSFLSGHTESYDVIQMSLIDTSAAVASGAYLLTEHSLYTQEAWTLIMHHLKPDGVFSVTRNLYSGWPQEVHRCLTLAKQALASLGVTDPRKHIILFEGRLAPHGNLDAATGMVTLLVSPTPFSDEMLARAHETETRLQFRERDFTRGNIREFELKILNPDTYADSLREAPVDISPPTDDRPFFFFPTKLDDLLKLGQRNQTALFYHKSVALLVQLLFWVSLLLLGLVVLPLAFKRRPPPSLHLTYFAGVGFGFMLVEVALMQMLSLYLGHPFYSLVAVLAILLLASGTGSFLSRSQRLQSHPVLVLLTLVALISLVGITHSLWAGIGGPLSTRLMISTLLVTPLGLLMGMPCPLGFALMSKNETEAAWCWGLNGASGVLASVSAILIALLLGLKTVMLLGACAYAVSALALWRSQK